MLHSRVIQFCLVVFAASLVFLLVVVEPTSLASYEITQPTVINSTPPKLEAEAYLVFDVVTGLPLLADNEHAVLPIASITKLFSGATVLRSLPLEATTTITYADVATEGRAGKLEAGEVYSNRDLLWPLLLESSNDAAAVFERIEPELLRIMNAQADAHEATETVFVDASGLSAGNISSAASLAHLTRNLYFQTPHIFDISRLPQFIGEQTGWVNNNPFVTEATYRGGKHGYTPEAGRTVVALFAEPLPGAPERLIGYVVLGSADLKHDVETLREYTQANVLFE